MERIRLNPLENSTPRLLCHRCMAGDHQWDRIADLAYCPNCQEALAQGEAPPLVLRTEPRRCAVCARKGSVRFLTFPLSANGALEIDLCGEHLRGLLGRRLGPYAFHQLQRQLKTVNLRTEDVFLLHPEFYDNQGKALRPAVGTE
jgi:hypothetical protein